MVARIGTIAGVDNDDAPAPAAGWLDEQEMSAWLQVVGILSRLPGALDAQLLRDAGLTHFEYEVLAGLSQAPQRTLRMSVLAEMARGSLSRLSHVVKRLERKGWVYREACPSDGRLTHAILTDAGYAKVLASAPGYVDNVRRLVIAPLTRAQLQQLGAIGRRLNAVHAEPGAAESARPRERQGFRRRLNGEGERATT
jgi:DNA-binding MarR family transcriptional regulator